MGDIQAEKNQALARFKGLQEQLTAQAYLKSMVETGQKVSGLVERLDVLHRRGYAFARELKDEIDALQTGWQVIETQARANADQAIQPVDAELRGLQFAYDTLYASEGVAAEIQANKLLSKLEGVAQGLAEVTRQVEAAPGDIPAQIARHEAQLGMLEGYMKHVEEACFPFNRDETVYIAVEAEWKKSKNAKDNPDGILYVTDQRLIMEQKEKQSGFMGLGGKKVQELAWQAPLGSLTEIAPEAPAETARITFGADGPFPETTVELKGGIEAVWFAAQVRRALSGEIDDERSSV